MPSRFLAIWFPYLLTDWLSRRRPDLAQKPFALCETDRGRIFVTATSIVAEQAGIVPGMALADARALVPHIEALDHKPERAGKLLAAMAEWCLRYTPAVSIDAPDGLFLDITGCAHLLGGEERLVRDLVQRFNRFGYIVKTALADTPGAAWAVCRYGNGAILPPGGVKSGLGPLPPAALRLEPETAETLAQLGIRNIAGIFALPRATLTRRFGPHLCLRLGQALGEIRENLRFHKPVPVYSERLASPEVILTADGIEAALTRLLECLCRRLEQDCKGLRAAELSAFRVDGRIERIRIGTGRPSHNPAHLLRLFREKLGMIDPGLGIELFALAAPQTDDLSPAQGAIFETGRFDTAALSELVDRLSLRLGTERIYRALPQESHLPERAARLGPPTAETVEAPWPRKPRPVHLLGQPLPIEVTAPIPDHPPVLFRHQGRLHRIRHADGPERIEPEWWIARGALRDYYRVEDDAGRRYWVFRAGHYKPEMPPQWFLHGYFA